MKIKGNKAYWLSSAFAWESDKKHWNSSTHDFEYKAHSVDKVFGLTRTYPGEELGVRPAFCLKRKDDILLDEILGRNK